MKGGYCNRKLGHFCNNTRCLLASKISKRWIGRRAGSHGCRRDNGCSHEHTRGTASFAKWSSSKRSLRAPVIAEIYVWRRCRSRRSKGFLLYQSDWEHWRVVRWSYKGRGYHRRIASQSVINRSPNIVSLPSYNFNLECFLGRSSRQTCSKRARQAPLPSKESI